MKNSGRTAFVFLFLTIIILVSAVAISIYMLQKETANRRAVEASLAELTLKNAKVEATLNDAQGQILVLEGKNKDADERINALLDDLEIEKGLRDEIKKENLALRDNLDQEAKAKLEIRNKLSQELEDLQSKLKTFESAAVQHKQDVLQLRQSLADFQKKSEDLEKQVNDFKAGKAPELSGENNDLSPAAAAEDPVQLDRIIVAQELSRNGKVLNIDTEAEFLIFDLGAKDGVSEGAVMSVYRGSAYQGDVRVTRVQDEMSAADFVPPLSSRKVRKNDLVSAKR
jgi:uncharacterized protein YpmB